MLLNLSEILKTAKENNFTVGAYNVTESTMTKAIIETAEQYNAPSIIAAATNEFYYAEKEYYKYVTERLKNSKIPFVLHLDHGKTYEDCARAIQAGFTSVMIDGSLLPFEENIKLTKKVVELAHACNVSVEGEIGTIGANTITDEGGEVSNICYTNPSDAKRFVEETGIDALAIAIGTAHGQYPKGYVPHLRFDILNDIKNIVDVPLVLHGGSNNPDEEIIRACKEGISKVNISSDFKLAYYRGIKEYLVETDDLYPTKIIPHGANRVKEVVSHKMDLFACKEKACLYNK